MAVKTSKLFKDYSFQKLSKESRLLYIYLTTSPYLSTIGVLSSDIRVMALESGLTKGEFRKSSVELVREGYIYVKKYNDLVYYIVPSHFDTIPKSDTSIKKINTLLGKLPDEFVEFLKSVGIYSNKKTVEFVKPTPDEVTNYALKQGYVIDGKGFVDYYESLSSGKKHWVDGRGKMVRSWQNKLKRVWCKEDRKLKEVKGAPEGYEYFCVIEDGKIYQPDGWRDGKPYSKNFLINKKLISSYDNG